VDTLVIVTSDHGEEFDDHGNFSHGHTHYRELLHVPLILHVPGGPRGVRIETPVSGVDLVPTALARLGEPVPQGLDGIDLSPSWRGAAPPERVILAETGPDPVSETLRSIRSGRFKLIRSADRVELYDVVDDPREQRNLAAARPELVAQLSARLDRQVRRAVRPSERVLLDEESLERLRALGYVAPD
jgi:arylsulfatase A-like enzyme